MGDVRWYHSNIITASALLSFLTGGEDTFYVSKFGFISKVTPPKTEVIDSTGSGDAFVSGIIYGLEKSLIFNEFVTLATLLGAENAEQLETCSVTTIPSELLKKKVNITPVGKKMKIIDDSPNS